MDKILEKMKNNGFMKRNSAGELVSTAQKFLIPTSTFHIISFYNSKVNGLLNFYKFASNYSSLAKIVWYFKLSCALTLALKFKLKTASKAFLKFGIKLTDPETGIVFKELENYKVKHDFSTTPKSFDDIIGAKWASSLTKTSAFDTCV
jgi:Type II intron maturase